MVMTDIEAIFVNNSVGTYTVFNRKYADRFSLLFKDDIHSYRAAGTYFKYF